MSAGAHRPAVPQVLGRIHPLEQSMGWVVFVNKSALGFFILLRLVKMVSTEGRSESMTLSTVLMTLCSLFLSGAVVSSAPHCDSTGQEAFNRPFVGLCEELAFKPRLPRHLDEVQPLLSSCHCCCYDFFFFFPGKSFGAVKTEELVAVT